MPECQKCTRKGVKIFMARFPTDSERKQIWIANIGKDNWNKTTDLYVCEVGNMSEMSIHFLCVIKIKIRTIYKNFL